MLTFDYKLKQKNNNMAKSTKIFQCLMKDAKVDKRVPLDFFKELDGITEKDYKNIRTMELGSDSLNVHEYIIKRIV